MKYQVLSNLELIRLLLEESKPALHYLAENSLEVHGQALALDEILTNLTWAIMNTNESNY